MSSVAFRCICNEPEGSIERTVSVLEFTPENLRKLYNKVSQFKTFMGKEVGSMEDMLSTFVTEDFKPKGLCLVVDDFIGIFWLTDINGLFEATVHYTFFDRRHRGRLELCREALNWAFFNFNFTRLATAVPEYEVKVSHFVQEIGFTYTGKLRKNRMIRTKLYDTLLYDILREEFVNGEQQSRLQTANNSGIKPS